MDRSTVLADDAVTYAQSKSRAALLAASRVERVENPGELMLADSAAPILDKNLNTIGRNLAANRHAASGLRCLNRIRHQIGEYLAHLGRGHH